KRGMRFTCSCQSDERDKARSTVRENTSMCAGRHVPDGPHNPANGCHCRDRPWVWWVPSRCAGNSMSNATVMQPMDSPRRTAGHRVLVGLLATVLPLSAAAQAGASGDSRPDVRTDDVARFFQVFDAADGTPDAEALQRGYLDSGSDALRELSELRIGSMVRLAKAIVDKPASFEKARTCVGALPVIRR